MAHKVFIDGEVGTTGLQIRERLAPRSDITLVQLDEARRKDPAAREAALAEADIAILCLPDEASKEAARLAAPHGTKLIDASTAHRVDPDWVYGFPEMDKGQTAAILASGRISNPGCWATCAIALIRPLVQAGLMDAASQPVITGVSGYSGGGKAMIAEYESGEVSGSFLYGVSQGQKHLPEIALHGFLTAVPAFVPSVGQYAQGMAVAIQLPALGVQGAKAAEEVFHDTYGASHFVSVVDASVHEPRVMPERLNGTNRLDLSVHVNQKTGSATLIALLDNLGKGSSGAAVQNLNILMGVDEATGL